MVILLVVSVPIAFLNELNATAALVLVRGADFLSLFDKPQCDALAMLFLNLHRSGIHVAEVFWGLWLFPLGMLVYRLGFLPRILGVLLMTACFAYLANSFTRLLLPGLRTRCLPMDKSTAVCGTVVHPVASDQRRKPEATG